MGRIVKLIAVIFIIPCLFIFVTCNNNLTTALKNKIDLEETNPPIPGGNGSISTVEARAAAVSLSWEKATDNVADQESLEYKIVYSVSDNIGSVEDAEANGTVGLDWTANIASGDVSGLSILSTYYMNVLVRDKAGNTAVYDGASATTTNDLINPTPGGGLAISNVGMETLTVSWNKGDDDITPESGLEYLVVYSQSNNISNVVEAEANGTPEGTWVSDIATLDVEGLLDNITYWVNVVIRDEVGNKAVYEVDSDTTVKHPRVFWVDMQDIRCSDMDGTSDSVKEIQSDPNYPYALAIDPGARKVYWTTSDSQIMIRRTDMDGGGVIENVISSHLTEPFGLAFDSVNQALYWTDHTENTIYKATLPISSADASEHVFTTSSVESPLGIDIDMVNGTVYWIEDRAADVIRECSISGGTITDHSATGVFMAPQDLAAYPTSSRLYICDPSNSNRIYSFNYSFSSRDDLVTDLDTQTPIGIDVYKPESGNPKIYWTDLGGGHLDITHALLDGSSVTDLPIADITYPLGIEVY